MSSPLNELRQKTIARKDVLLLETPKEEFSKEAKVEMAKHEKLGINTSTTSFLKEKKNDFDKKESSKRTEVAKNEMLKWFMANMSPFKIISYKKFYQICVDHHLFIHRLSAYRNIIPDHALDSMESFLEKLSINIDSLEQLNVFGNNKHFTFDTNFQKSILAIDTKNIFKIAGPLHHFDKETFNLKVGQELGNVVKPAITGNIDLRSIPKPIDPLIFVPFKNAGEVFCLYVDGWDKEADDERLRQLF